MATKTNMEKAKRLETNFWIICTVNFALLLFYGIYQPTNTEFVFFIPMIWVACMGGCAFRAFRIYRSEISNLKPGDTNASDAIRDSE